MSLKGKAAIVTGSTSGIGLAIAKAFAGAGADVVINGVGDQAKNQKVIDELAKTGSKIVFVEANLMVPADVRKLVSEGQEKLGRLDILVNNAGIQHVSPVAEFPEEKWDQIIALNLSAAFHAIKAAIPHLRKGGFGRIINIASAHSLRASPNKAAYVAAKHGIAGLTKTVALELAREGITVNAISPGYVWTPLVETQIPDFAKSQGITEEEAKFQILEKQPTKEFATVDQIAALALFLTGDAAKPITGSNYSIDGGWTAQ